MSGNVAVLAVTAVLFETWLVYHVTSECTVILHGILNATTLL